MRRVMLAILAMVLTGLWAGGSSAEPSFLTFRGQGGVPHHPESSYKDPAREPAAVIGTDEREHVEDTTEYPYSAIALLNMFSNLGEGQCTGTFIGEDVLITAAHCLWDSENGFVDDVLVKPGKNGFGTLGAGDVHAEFEPFGSEFAWDWAVPTEYINSNGSDSTWDFGLVVMTDGALGNTVGWLTVGNLQTSTLERPDFAPAIIGYPADLGDGEEMWGATQPSFLDVDDFLLYYDIDTGGGESGSAIISLNQLQPTGLVVVGIHTTGTPDYNFGTRIDEELLDTILGMCDDVGCTIDHYTEPFVQGLFWADADCDGGLSTRDNQAILRVVLSQPPLIQTEPCADIGTGVTVNGFGLLGWADVDCNGQLTTRDNQALLRAVLGQSPLSQTQPCPGVGDEVTLG